MGKIVLNRGTHYKGFVYLGSLVNIGEFSQKKFLFKCKCGKSKEIRLAPITNGKTRSCGNCNSVTIRNGSKFNSLTYFGNDFEVRPKSEKKVLFKCRCGRTKFFYIFSVISGHSKSCGECTSFFLKTGETYNGFTYIGPSVQTKPNSNKKLHFKCKCGRTKFIKVCSTKRNKSCGECINIKLTPGDQYFSFKYRGENIIDIGPWTKEKIPFECKCGSVKNIGLNLITSGDVTSCSECYVKILNWYKTNEKVLRLLQAPIKLIDFPVDGVVPLEDIKSSTSPFRALCFACKMPYKPRLSDIKKSKCLTCGCVNNKISSPVVEIKSFIDDLGHKTEFEYKISTKFFDIFVPSKNLLIEFNGLRWHSYPSSKKKDLEKYKLAVDNGFQFICIFEDEWKNKKGIIKSLIKNRLDSSVYNTLRPSKCSIKKINHKESSCFYERFHYSGSCISSVNYGVFFGPKLVSCISFRKPVRQTIKQHYELSRMVSDPSYKVHGIWSKLLKMFVDDYDPKTIVSFSDNRLFSGEIYSKLGFHYDGESKPDYYWVKGRNRHHKSFLRKPKNCELTESELRTSQGYKKIWDLGKKRWVYSVKAS